MAEGDWPIIGNKFRVFPYALGDCLEQPNVILSAPEPVQEELLLTVHTPSLLRRERNDWYKDTADQICAGTYIVITHGGSRADVARQIFPEIVRILAS
jgi:hypothetical protein